jgi:DnaJ family protein C protein 17
LRRLALDAKLRATQARKERFKAYDAKRKNLVEELEERERAFKRARVQKQKEEMEAYTSTERIKEEGRRMREEREKALKEAEKAKLREEGERKEEEEGLKERGVGAEGVMDVDEPPPLDQFDTTVRLKYSLKSKPDLTSKEAIAAYLVPFGPVDVDSIVFSMKAKKSKSKSKNGEGAL